MSGLGTTHARRHDYLFTFSFDTYADAVRRGMMRPPDRILSTLLDHPSVGRVVVANPMRWFARVWAGVLLDRPYRFPTSERAHLEQPARLSRRGPISIAEIQREYARYGRLLERAARMHLEDRPLVLTTHPWVAGFSDLSWAGGVTYFGRDDWASGPPNPALIPSFVEAYRRMSAAGHAVSAVSQQIVDRIQPTGPSLVLPNGVEPSEWLGRQPSDPPSLKEIPHPRATYAGTLDSRLDVDGIVELASRRPDLQIVLVGPAPNREYLKPVSSHPNVYVRPQVGRSELVACLRNSDIGLLAHHRTPLTEAMSPLKVYEYLAAGCPVLATDLPPIRRISDRVLLAPDVASLAELVSTALTLGRWEEASRQAFINQNSWAERHNQLLELAVSTTRSSSYPQPG